MRALLLKATGVSCCQHRDARAEATESPEQGGASGIYPLMRVVLYVCSTCTVCSKFPDQFGTRSTINLVLVAERAIAAAGPIARIGSPGCAILYSPPKHHHIRQRDIGAIMGGGLVQFGGFNLDASAART